MPLLLVLAQAAVLVGLYLVLFWMARLMLAELRPRALAAPGPALRPGSGQLVVVRGEHPHRGETFVLASTTVSMGRDPGNELVVADPFASATHARIVVRQGGYWIEDLGSKNGTRVNGQRIARLTPLTPGDCIDIGDTRFRFQGAQS